MEKNKFEAAKKLQGDIDRLNGQLRYWESATRFSGSSIRVNLEHKGPGQAVADIDSTEFNRAVFPEARRLMICLYNEKLKVLNKEFKEL